MSGIYLTTMKIPADNSKLEKDDKGYYRVILGGFNSFNSAGHFYTDEGIKELLTSEDSPFYKKLKRGVLKSEVGHPEFVPGMSKAMFYNRNLKISLPNTCAHIRDVILTPTSQKSELPGYDNYILTEGYVKPSGPHGDALQKALDNPEENVAFSIRCFTENKMVNGVLIKKILQIITWDWVNEPGIKDATKWKQLSIESNDLMHIPLEELVEGNSNKINECFNCSLEDGEVREITEDLISKLTVKDNGLLDIL